MKCTDRNTASRLEELPNIGRAIAAQLARIDITHPSQLRGADPYQVYEQLCTATGIRRDPCLLDALIAAVHYMDGGEARPWWSFTELRKQTLRRDSQTS